MCRLGEVFIEERNNTWNTPYLFNSKELDEETGLVYYGARYYDPRILIWLSVDPLAEKDPNMTPYHYCSNNPVNMTDPDGRDDRFNQQGRFIEHIDNGTNNIVALNHKGEFQNITDFDYSEGQAANRKMLSNIGGHYANSIGIAQTELGLYDYDIEGPFAYTDRATKQVGLVIVGGKLNYLANDSYNMTSSLVHEKDHTVNPAMGTAKGEIDAIIVEIMHPAFTKTTLAFKQAIVSYATDNLRKELQNNSFKGLVPDQVSTLNRLISGIGTIEYNSSLNSVSYNLSVKSVTVEVKGPKKKLPLLSAPKAISPVMPKNIPL